MAGTETTTLTGVFAKGDAYVDVKIDTTSPTTNSVVYGITQPDLAADVTGAIGTSPTAVTLDKFGVTDATTDTLAITLGKDGSINANEPVKFTATVVGNSCPVITAVQLCGNDEIIAIL